MFNKRQTRFDKIRNITPNYINEISQEYPSNFIVTSKYTATTFFPYSLLEQFRRYANIYFLITAILQSIPSISPLNPFTAVAPLVFVLALSMAREGYEDYQRHLSDDELNAMQCTRLQNGQPVQINWKDVQVGDFLLIKQDEIYSADILLLQSSLESGVCFIETSQLDGEKNLKSRSAIKETLPLYNGQKSNNQDIKNVNADPPNSSLGEFKGKITIKTKDYSIDQKALLLRGACQRNTEWAIGIVIYTGEDTKIMRNAEPGRVKTSNVEVLMNKLIITILFFQMMCYTILTLFALYMNNTSIQGHWYLQYQNDSYFSSVLIVFTYFILLNAMIPISLIVSLEFVKLFQAYFINKDNQMHSKIRDKFARVHTSSINEELGQVEYVFSDKTGTLTCNQMEFKYAVIGNNLYGKEDSQKFKDEKIEKILTNQISPLFIDLTLQSKDKSCKIVLQSEKDLIDQYLLLLSSAHECIVEKKNDQITYQGPSPDEIALVETAKNQHYTFVAQSASQIQLQINGKDRKLELLKQFEFDSTRKRMSVIVRDQNRIIMYMKGADNIIKKRLSTQDQRYLINISNYLDSFSTKGLRTLMMCMKIISEQEYKEFNNKFNQADKLAQAQMIEEIETDMYLIGATAVEDKLQDRVSETITDLLSAQIKVWMLTGDKLETAENIGKSCGLIKGDMTVMRLQELNKEILIQKIRDLLETFQLCIIENRKKCVLIDGECLLLIQQDNELLDQLKIPLFNSESVICCRVTPKQKADVVRLVKSSLNSITLAIGDGANDVNMIQEAHIGIGLYGNEGMRAVQSSDYALGEFKFLYKLLLIHGHWSYVRIAEMILYFFYKNMALTIIQFYFAFLDAFSGQSIFDDWYISFYNLFFTALPLIVRATLDQDIVIHSKNTEIEKFIQSQIPHTYYIGRQNTIFTGLNFLSWTLQGAVHGLIVFYVAYWQMKYDMLGIQGYNSSLWGVSITIYSSIIVIVDLKLAIHTRYWTSFNLIALTLLSFILYVIYMIISNFVSSFKIYQTPLQLLTLVHFYLVIILSTGTIFVFDLFVLRALFFFKATLIDLIRWLQIYEGRQVDNNMQSNFIEKFQIFSKRMYQQIQTPNLKAEEDYTSPKLKRVGDSQYNQPISNQEPENENENGFHLQIIENCKLEDSGVVKLQIPPTYQNNPSYLQGAPLIDIQEKLMHFKEASQTLAK